MRPVILRRLGGMGMYWRGGKTLTRILDPINDVLEGGVARQPEQARQSKSNFELSKRGEKSQIKDEAQCCLRPPKCPPKRGTCKQ